VRLRNESDARDALQEAMTDAWRGLPGLRRADRFWPWLVAIAARKAAAVVRGRGAADELDVTVAAEDDPGVVEIWDMVGHLPARYRDVLILRYRLELTEEETAQALRIRVGTVKSRCARGRKALMELLA
jgi:RNA polymerase sigma-70 factor (ECF subfamily)